MTKIAFIDDQQDKLDPARELLVSEGYEVERHRDGDFALAVFQRRKADLVVINLSGQNAKGMALLERIREKWTVPVVMLSAAKDEID